MLVLVQKAEGMAHLMNCRNADFLRVVSGKRRGSH
jgi:hypothetical protein